MLWICKETLSMRKLQTKTRRNYAGNGGGRNSRLQFPLEIDINWAKHPKSLEMPSLWGFNLLNCTLVIQAWLWKSYPLYMLKSASRGSQHNLTSFSFFAERSSVSQIYSIFPTNSTNYPRLPENLKKILPENLKKNLSKKLHQSASTHNHWNWIFKQLCYFYSKKIHMPTSLRWG